MLSRIFIKNFALIDQLEIDLQKGLQVITGETGAGKSIILGALRLILGERADAKLISNSETKSIVEAEFNLDENFKNFFEEKDLDFDNQTIIRREILPTGKSRAFVNDVPVTLDVLKNISEKLIDIHSQFETSQLFNEEYQFKIIDGLSENKKLINSYQSDFSEFQKLGKRLETLKTQFSEGNKEADYKLFLLNELVEANLDDLDLENLQNQLNTQENAGTISEELNQILNQLNAEELGVLNNLNEVKNKLSKISNLTNQFSDISKRINESFYEIKDITSELETEAEKVELNPVLINELSSKLNKINTLLQKHNVNSVAELVAIRDAISNEQIGFADLVTQISFMVKEISEKEKNLTKVASQLSTNRKKSSAVFKSKTENLLQKLGLEKAKVEVSLTENKQFTRFGKENIQLLFQANSGFPLKAIQEAISGGERSRVMLSIKKLMAENSKLPTLVLDEIDTGVSGRIAEEMGKVMQEMSQNMQLIVITHLAQIAAKGNNNYKVVKEDISGKTQTKIKPLNSDEKLQEIAQLLSGSKITEAALEQAKELMN